MITDHPNYGAIRSYINTTLALIKTKQTVHYRNNENQYFQGLMIPSQKQLSGESYDAIDFGLHPDDQADSWYTFLPDHFNEQSRIPINISCQVYSGPSGDGWIFKAELWKSDIGPDLYGNDGSHWIWQHHEGPENRQGVWDDWFIQPEFMD